MQRTFGEPADFMIGVFFFFLKHSFQKLESDLKRISKGSTKNLLALTTMYFFNWKLGLDRLWQFRSSHNN